MYRKYHCKCPVDVSTCTDHTAYIRAGKQWIKIGTYHDVCETFTTLDTESKRLDEVNPRMFSEHVGLINNFIES